MGKAAQVQLEHRRPVVKRLPEVTTEEAGDEAAVLHDQRLVEAELPADHLEIVPGGAGLDEQDRGIAGDPHEEKYGH